MSDEIWKVKEHYHLHLQVKYDCRSGDYQTTGLDRWMWSPNEVLFILFHKEHLNSCSYLRCGDLCYIHVCVCSVLVQVFEKSKPINTVDLMTTAC